MSGNSGPLASTKGDPPSTTSKSTTKSGFDHLDVNRLFKGKVSEPVTKSVTQKHGMQTLGKALPARRAGNTVSLKSEEIPTENSVPLPQGPPILPNNSQPPPQGYSLSEDQRRQQELQQAQGWTNSHPPPPGQHRLQNMPGNGPMHDKKWSGPERANGSYASHRFAQEFPSLDAAGEPHKAPPQNFAATGGPGSRQANAKSQDNQYGPGPILRPQTEGSWTQGGGRRPSGPPPLNASNYPPDRVNLGGPTPQPMSLVQGGPIPPPLGAFPMQFRGQMQNPSYMYPNSGSGGFYPGGPGSGIRYGMPIPHGAPPPPGGLPVDGPPRGGRPAPPTRPGSHFANKPIIRAEEMERMDEIGTQDGGWASTSDDIDYNKKINFSDDEEGGSDQRKRGKVNNVGPQKELERKEEERPVKILERERSLPEAGGLLSRPKDVPQPYEYENGEDWNSRRGYENKDRDRGGPRRLRDDDWRSGSNRYEEDNRGKKSLPGGGRQDTRVPEFQSQSSKYGNTNVPPRFLKNQGQSQGQGHGPAPATFNQQPSNQSQRQTPSPIATSTGKGRDTRDQQVPPTYKILERQRGDSESSRESRDGGRFPRDKRNFNTYESEPRNERYAEQEYGKNSRYGSSDFGRDRQRGHEDSRKPDNRENRNSVSSLPDSKEDLEIKVKETEEKRDESKQAFRKKPELSTTSWAEEMDEAESLNENISDSRKKEPSLPPPKKEEPKSREARRVIIHQTKVADMRTHVKEASPPTKKEEPKHDDRDRRGPRRDVKHPHQNNPVEQRQHPKDEHKVEHPKHHGPVQLKSEPSTEHAVESRKPIKEPSPPVQAKKEEPKSRENRRVIIHQTKVGDLRPPVKEPSPPAAPPAKKEEPKHEEREKREDRPEQQRHDRRDERHDRHENRRDDRPDNRHDIRREDRPERRDDRQNNRRDDRRDNRRGPSHPDHNKPAEPRQQHPKTEVAAEPKAKVVLPPAPQPKEEVPTPIEKPKPSSDLVGETKETGDGDDRSNNGRKNGADRSNDYIYKRGAKAPAGPRRNQNQRGASRLQGYGPPSDRKPFSSNNNKQDEDVPLKEKTAEGQGQVNPKPTPPVMAAPVPLMALGEISPPEMSSRNRHHGGGGGGYRDRDRESHGLNRTVPPRLQRGGGIGGGTERGRGEHQQSNRGKKKADSKAPGSRPNDTEKDGGHEDREVDREAEVPKKPTVVEPAPAPSGNAWTKPITQALRSDLIQSAQQQSSTPPPEPKETLPMSTAPASLPPNPSIQQGHGFQPLDSTCPKTTMIFENTKLKSVQQASKFPESFNKGPKGPDEQQQQQPSSLPTSIEKTLDLPLSYGKAPGGGGGVAACLDFGTSFENESVPVGVVPKSGGPRPFAQMSHQPSTISPQLQAVELTEGLQAVRSLWDSPAVNDQPNVLTSDDPSLSAFGGDTFKRPEVSREVRPSLQTSIGYTPGNTPSISVIAKPTSSSSPNSANNIRMKSVQQPSVMESQAHVPHSFSPFGYGMPQQHQPANAFGGIPSVASTPSQQMYGKPHTAPGPNPVYQAFQHPESSHVMSGNTRSQFSGYASVQPGGGPGPYGSLYLPTFDNHYSVPSYGHGHQGQSGGGPQGQVPQGNSRMSPSSAMPMTSSSGLVVGGMNSAGSNSFKAGRNGTGSHQALPHPGHHGPQQGYSQMTHHLNHPSHHMSGPQKGNYSQSGLPAQTQPQLFIQFDPNQAPVLNIGQNYLSSAGMRSGGGPPPSATPPMQGLPSSGSYYGSSSNQGGVYPGGSSQGGNMQQMHMAVAPGPQSLPGPNPHYGLQFQPPMSMQGYSSQGPGSVGGNPMIRPGHANRK